MSLQSRLLQDTVEIQTDSKVLLLNSAENAFVVQIAKHLQTGELILAEDSVASLAEAQRQLSGQKHVQHVAFHDYISQHGPEGVDIAILDMLYQPSNAWMLYAIQVAHYALRAGGRVYVVGAKDRGVMTMGKRVKEIFANVETLSIGKGHRVLGAVKRVGATDKVLDLPSLRVFADSQLDAGTRQLLGVLEVHANDCALDIGCGAGFLGLHIARQAPEGRVAMVDASLAAVAVAQQMVEQEGLDNITVYASDGVQAVLAERFDLVVTNPPFHQGGLQTTTIAERFIREAAQVLKPAGRFYVVANRFLKYEPELRACFASVTEVGGDTRYKVLRATGPLSGG